MTDIISFEVKDWAYPELEKVAEDLALLIHKHKGLTEDLNTFMRISAPWWKKEIQAAQFQIWKNRYIGNHKKAAPDKIQLAEELQRVKEVCETSEEWDKMRGLIPEKIFEYHFNEKHTSAIKEYGAQVSVHGQPIIYEERQSAGTLFTRKTVDAGSWDGKYGEFAEVKFQPERFEYTDIGYLKLLEERLNYHEIKHCIFLVSFDKDISYVRSRLEKREVLPVGSKFEVLGPEEFVFQ